MTRGTSNRGVVNRPPQIEHIMCSHVYKKIEAGGGILAKFQIHKDKLPLINVKIISDRLTSGLRKICSSHLS